MGNLISASRVDDRKDVLAEVVIVKEYCTAAPWLRFYGQTSSCNVNVS